MVVCKTEYVLHGWVLDLLDCKAYIKIHVNLPPVMALNKHAREIASPVAAHPSKALTEILRTVFQCGLYFRFLVVLHFDLPSM